MAVLRQADNCLIPDGQDIRAERELLFFRNFYHLKTFGEKINFFLPQAILQYSASVSEIILNTQSKCKKSSLRGIGTTVISGSASQLPDSRFIRALAQPGVNGAVCDQDVAAFNVRFFSCV